MMLKLYIGDVRLGGKPCKAMLSVTISPTPAYGYYSYIITI